MDRIDYSEMEPDVFRRQLRLLLADRSTPEAAAMFEVLMAYTHKRVMRVSQRCGNSLSRSRQEELVADVLLQMMDGGLARFRGGTLPELLAFVRTIADRVTWRSIKRYERERNSLAQADTDTLRSLNHQPESPDSYEVEAETSLSPKDQEYLLALMAAGSKAELARKAGVSRAAVTQRIQRIRSRIESLGAQERAAHEVWMQRSARQVLATATFDP